MPSTNSSRLPPYSVQATTHHSSSSSTSEGRSPASQRRSNSAGGALQHAPRRASDGSGQHGKGATSSAGQSSRSPAPGGAYTGSVIKQAGLLRDAADEETKAAVAGARRFRSAMFSVSTKPAAAAATSHTSSATATALSSSKARSQSTPRSGGSITAVPGRPRVVQPASTTTSSSSSIAAKKLTAQGPLAAGMAGQKPATGARSSTSARTNVSPRDSKSGVGSSTSSGSSAVNSSRIQAPTSSAAGGRHPASTASGRYSNSQFSTGSTSAFDAAAEAAAAAAGPPLRSQLALKALLQLKEQRHQQQKQVLERDASGQAEQFTVPASAAVAAHPGSSSSSSSSMGTCSRPAGAYASVVAGSGAAAGPTRRVSASSGGSGTYLDRVSAASTTLQHQQLAAAAAAAVAAVGGVIDRAPPRRADGGSALPAGAQLPDTAAESAAAAAGRQRVNVDASPLMRHLPVYGAATAGSSMQQHAYAGASATATCGSEQYARPPLYRPELYAAADTGVSGRSAATAALLQRNKAQLQQQLEDRLAKLQLQPGYTETTSATDSLQQQQQQHASTVAERVRDRVSAASMTSSSVSSTKPPATHGAAVAPAYGSAGHHGISVMEHSSVAYQYGSRQHGDQLPHTGTGYTHSAAATSASLAAAPLTASGRRFAHSGSLGDTQLPPASSVQQPVTTAPVRAPHPLYTLSPQQAQQVVQPQQQQQLAGSIGSAAAYDSYSAAAAAGTQPRTSESGAAAAAAVDLGWPTSRSAANAYVGTYRPATQTGSLGAGVISSTTSSYYSSIAAPSAAADKGAIPCAPRYNDSRVGSAGPAAAATAAAMYRSSRYSSAGDDAAPSTSSFATASQQQPQQQQQQQQASSMSRAGSAASSTVLSSRQPSFLIGTHPMSEDIDDGRSGLSPGAALSSHSRGLYSGYSQGEDDAAAQQQAAAQFLSCDFVASRSSSATVEQGRALQADQQQQVEAAAAAVVSKVQSFRAAAHGAVHRHLAPASGGSGGTAGTKGVVSIPGGGLVEAVEYAASDDSSDVSEVTEMSTSLDHSIASSSSSSGSDSEDCAAPGISEAVRRRLLGVPRGHGSSISISTEGRSSSCGSGRELETESTTAVANNSSGRQLAVSSSSSRPRKLPQGCMGLNNLGNTCFMNSILQCLNCLPELVAALLGPRIATCIAEDAAAALRAVATSGGARWGPKASVGPALCELLREMWSQQDTGAAASAAAAAAASAAAGAGVRRRGCAVSPRQFLEAVSSADERWGDGCQQDSQEFLHSLLEQLQSECNRVQGKPQYTELSSHGSVLQQAAEAAAYARSWHDSLVDDLFGGQLQSTITCSACGAQSHCFDPFLDLSVPLPRGKAQVSLQDCLSAFVEQEVLTGSEAVKCGSCKRTCDATKRLQIFQCPQLLVLTLKRFNSGSSSRGGGAGGWAGSGGGGWFGFSPYSKNQTPVKVDAQHALDLSPYCNQQALKAAVDGAGTGRGCSKPHYQLLAVSEHSGCLGGGHYTAQGRNVADGRWYDFNDASVTPDSHPSGSSSSAYVLFFRLIGDCV